MVDKKKKLLVGNWKMNPETAVEARKTFGKIKTQAGKLRRVDTVICPPAVFLGDLARSVTGKRCVLGAQNCHEEVSGAHTGSVSAREIASLKAKYCIVGHSERRAAGEGDELIAKKVKTALDEGLSVILCIGESVRDKDAQYLKFIKDQIHANLKEVSKKDLGRVIIAYEPIWAIGKHARRPAKPADVFEMKIYVRKVLTDAYGSTVAKQMYFLYGGSADENNTEEFLLHGEADGLLVGRASNNATQFGKMLGIAEEVGKMKK